MYFELKQFSNDEGKLIYEKTFYDIKNTDKSTLPSKYTGSITLGIPTPEGMVPHPLEFEITSDSIVEAFLRFDHFAKNAIKNFEEEFKKPRLTLPPGTQQPPKSKLIL